MPYTDPTDLRLALAPAGDTGPATAASLTDAELADAIGEAQQEVDARLSDQYGVPFADGAVPALVAQVTRDLAAFKATLVHRRGNPLDSRDPVWLRYEHALSLLRQMGRGEVDLPGVADTASSGEAAVVNPYEGTLFGLSDFGLGVRP